jgi:hypothetical protein
MAAVAPARDKALRRLSPLDEQLESLFVQKYRIPPLAPEAQLADIVTAAIDAKKTPAIFFCAPL